MTLKKLLGILLLCALSLSFAACSLFGADAVAEKKTPCDAETESKGADERSLAVVMYHNVLKSRKGVYIVSPEQLEADLIAFEKAGYTVDRKVIVLKEPVKEVGSYVATLKLHKEVAVDVAFDVVSE